MRKTLALLLAVAFLYLAAYPSLFTRSQALVTATKYYTVPNPIPNRFIVVLATTNLSPIAAPAPTPIAKSTKTASASALSSETSSISADESSFMASPDSSSAFFVAAPPPTDSDVTATAIALTADYGGTFSLTWSDAVDGFLLNATEPQAIAMSQDSRVAFVQQEGAIAVGSPDTDPILMGPPDPLDDRNPQPNASWGLDRIDQHQLPLDNYYGYLSDGEGVTAYVIDTGILPTHYEFRERAFAIYDAVDREGSGVDCNGHGSHVAGTIGGRKYGVAKKVRLFGVRVLNCQGTGTWSNVIDGVNFVTWHSRHSGQQSFPALANMSLAGATNRAADAAVRNSIRAGVTYVVAAGNGSGDVTAYSPAGVLEAITVGATNRQDSRAEFSNYGSILDLFAPGVSITSAWIGNDQMQATATGTSMASPHVAGVVAQYLQRHPSASPAEVRSALIGNSTTGVVINPGQETPNRLLYTDRGN
jgi:subtilisin family serine protease